MPSVLDAVRCPRCATTIDVRAPAIACPFCHQRYPRLGAVPILLTQPGRYLSCARQQLEILRRNAGLTVQGQTPDLLPHVRERLLGMIEAVNGQVADLDAILGPLLPAEETDPQDEDALGDFLSPIKHVHYLYRDWGWPAERDGENERTVSLVEAVLEGRALGRTMVLGAGACRLAYDLHHRHGGGETVAIDIDPLLLTVAHTVIRGGRVSLREANAEIDEIDRISRRWELKAPDGALADDRFHFLLADGLAPPFASGAFDTVVTPWFIDLIPPDVRESIGTPARLLLPGAAWVSIGPLRYTPNMPVARRFTRQEVFELAGRAGFHVGKWQAESMPYLVSKLSRRGKIEWVLAFTATKT